MYELEPLSVIVLITMVVLLLFQKRILVLFRRVYERSVFYYKILMFACIPVTIYFLPRVIMSLSLGNQFYLEFVGYSLGSFILIYVYKLWRTLIVTSIRSIKIKEAVGIVIFLFIFLLFWIYDGQKYLSHEGPTFIDMLIIAVFFINWLDFTVHLSRDIR